MPSGYRADIDGLRAIAIVPVLLFHAGVAGFGGGYVGVDIFFVISGYLITGIIAREIDEGRFTIIGFYERRARRIMPALIAMITAVLAAAALLYLPGDFESVPGSAIAATLFASNLWFFTHTGYFAGGAETMPLLHTWSLAVEEQFYIGFPILLILIARFGARWRTAIVAAATLISFALALATQARGDGIAFYLLPPRAWELFAGSLLALGALPAMRSRPLREAIAGAGLAAIAYAVASFGKATIFPGATALFPVLGAMALIHAAPGTLTGRLLALRPLVAIGLISYSLYLWHWPLIVFTEYWGDAKPTGWVGAAVITASIAAAALSWRFIERPFRDRRRIGRARIFGATGIAMGIVCLAAGAMATTHGWPARFAPEVVRLDTARTDYSPLRKPCHDSDPARGRMPCAIGAAVPPDALMWGDSHGVELAYAIAQLPSRRGHALYQRTRSSCPPVLDYDIPGNPRCAINNRAVFDTIRADPRLKTIYLAAFWASYPGAPPAFWSALDRTIALLRNEGRRVVVFGAIPSNPVDVPRHLARLAAAGKLETARGSERATLLANTAQLRPLLARWRRQGVTVIDPADSLCGPRWCDVIRTGRPLYFDSHHLSLAGTTLVAAALEKPSR